MKSLIPPYAIDLRTKKQRKARARIEPDTGFAESLAMAPVSVCLNSKRKNKKNVRLGLLDQIHYWGVWCFVGQLKDGRFIYHVKQQITNELKSDTTVWPPFETIVSHSLENLWWYGVPEAARKAMTGA